MQIKNRQQTLVILAIAVAVLFFGDRVILPALTTSWKARAAQIDDLKKSIDKGSLLLQRENSLRAHWDKMRTNTLPNNVSVAENKLFKAFDRWADASRVSLGAIKPQFRNTDEDYATIECRADASGSIDSLSKFLYEIERDPLAVKVESLDISSRDDNGRQISIVLQLSGLILTPPETTPKP